MLPKRISISSLGALAARRPIKRGGMAARRLSYQRKYWRAQPTSRLAGMALCIIGLFLYSINNRRREKAALTWPSYLAKISS